MPAIPESYHDLFERPTTAHVVTLFPDGRPHATPVWIGYDAADDRLLVNTDSDYCRSVRDRPHDGVRSDR